MAWKDIKDQFSIEDIGASLLANLAKGIYSPEAVLREYVQNAADAYSDLEDVKHKKLPIAEKTIHIYLQDGNTLAVQDDGIGMNADEIKHYKRIALSGKLGKDRAGFRGIGIWAGFSACDVLQVETTKLGDSRKYRLTLMFAEMRQHVNSNIDVKQLLDKRFKIEVADAPATDHYTQVRLVNLHDEFRDLLKAEELVRVVRQILPCRIDPQFKFAAQVSARLNALDVYHEFAINVQDVEVFRPFPSTVNEPVFESLVVDGEECAFVWYCASPSVRSIKPNDQSKFRIRVRNIGVGGPGLYSQENGLHWGIREDLSSPELLDWYIGEIHITDPDVRPNTPRTELELDANARKCIARIRQFYEERITYRRAYSDVNSHVTAVAENIKHLRQGLTLDAEAGRLLKGLTKYDVLSRPLGKKKLEGIEAQKRKILKQKEAEEPSIAKDRRELIEHLETSQASAGAKRGRKGQGGKPTKAGKTASATAVTSLTTTQSSDYERLLGEILIAIEKNLGDQDELAAKLSEAVEDIFKRQGLLVAV